LALTRSPMLFTASARLIALIGSLVGPRSQTPTTKPFDVDVAASGEAARSPMVVVWPGARITR
jgi:hypothetical protein